jgi:hypothetical protein
MTEPEANTKPVPYIEDVGIGDPKKKHRLRNTLIAGGIVVILIAAYAGGTVYANTKLDNAQASYQKANAIYVQKRTEGAKLAKTSQGKALDPKTIETLSQLTKRTAPDVSTATGSSWALWDAINGTTKYEQSAKALSDDIKNIDAAIKQVNASVDAKNVKTAKDSLTNAETAARKLLADSNGKVADNKTREALTNAINSADKALKNAKGDAASLIKAYSNAAKPIADTTKQVNASMKAKTDADSAAKAAADAAAAQAASQPSYMPSYGYSSTPSYTPAYNAPNTDGSGNTGVASPSPVPKQPNGGNSSGGLCLAFTTDGKPGVPVPCN